MQDFVRDWRRWTPVERVTAVVIATILSVGVPIALVISVQLTVLGHGANGI